MKELLIYFIMFIFVYLFYLIFVLNRKSVLKNMKNGKEMSYLKYKYDIKITDKNLKKVANLVALSNSFIISTTVFVVSLFDSMLLEIVFGLITLIILILLIYHILGKLLRGGNKNV